MKISILGLGYVGVVSAACLAGEGYRVIGVDPVSAKVDIVNSGKSPIIEKGVDERIGLAVANERFRATTDVEDAVLQSDISFVCVGTPSLPNGDLDVSYVRRVCRDIGTVLKKKSRRHVVVIRSTILPGTMENIVIPTLEEVSGKIAGQDFGVCNNPEFLREGSAVDDFYNPPKTVIGETDTESGDLLASLYQSINAPLVRTDIKVAEMVKYVDNVWHALKVGFSNEIGTICKQLKIDSHRVMDIFCLDTKLNISSSYMKPGFAFGGSCLPKDLRALTYRGKSLDLDLPILNAILPSNGEQVERAIKMIVEQGHRKVGILGFSFKAGTDDLRESPVIELVERLIGKGYDIRLYDKNVNLATLMGANKAFILEKLPHISRLMVETVDEVLAHAKTIVIGNSSLEFKNIMDRVHGHGEADKCVVDLVRIMNGPFPSHYEGICW